MMRNKLIKVMNQTWRELEGDKGSSKGSNISKQTKDDEVTAVKKIKKFQIRIKTKTIVKLVLWRMRIKQLWKKVTPR